MVRLIDRGTPSRLTVLKALIERPNQTEDELLASTGLSKSTTRNALQLLLQTKMADTKRRKQAGKRGPGRIEYWLTEHRTPDDLEAELRKRAARLGQPEDKPAPQARSAEAVPRGRGELFVLVKAGTNDAILTKEGHMLRIEQRALPTLQEHYRRLMRGAELEAMALDDYYARFYPETRNKRDRPVLQSRRSQRSFRARDGGSRR